MRINFCLRTDGERKPGGDTSKAQRLAAELRRLGLEVDITYGALATARADVVHLVNIDLPIENLLFVADARGRRQRVVLSTVHHPFSGIREFYRFGNDRFFSSLNRMGVGVERAISIREAAKLAVGKVKPRGGLRPTLSNQQALAASADMLLPMSVGEQDAILRDLGDAAPMSIVPNGATFAPGQPAERRWDIVAVGRIEPRKNVLQVARAATLLGKSALFVGPPNSRHKRYVEAFDKLVRDNDAITWTGRVNNDQVPGLIAQADLYINAAWFEVVSQADVEAAGTGVRVASTKHSYARDIVGAHHKVDPLGFATDPAAELERAFTEASTCTLDRLPTWSDAAGELARVYAQIS